MKRKINITSLPLIWATSIIPMLLIASPALGAETPEWRPIYDLVMRWVNFLIIVGVLIKFGRSPIKNFLQRKKTEIALELEKVEQKKEETVSAIENTRRHLEESSQRLQSLHERILKQGEAQKAQIIAQAQEQSRRMMMESKRKIEGQLRQAKETFRAELVDLAFQRALERLPREISKEDNQKIVFRYLQEMEQ